MVNHERKVSGMTSAARRRHLRLARLELGNALGGLSQVLEKLALAAMHLQRAEDDDGDD